MKWLHISDLHVDSSYMRYVENRGDDWISNAPPSSDDFYFFASFFKGLKARVREKKVDFIVFTGDLFNHGRWNQGQRDAALQFLEDVYRVCAEACSWKPKWKSGMRMTRLFYCPGNHDVFRSAYRIRDDSFVMLRSNLLESIADPTSPIAPSGGFFCNDRGINSHERQVLTEHTFSLFFNAMQNCADYQSGDDNKFRYEFRLFTPPGVPVTPQKKGAVVALNTALLAGRAYSQKDITKALTDAWNDFQQAHAKFDFDAARKAYDAYQDAYLKQQGLLRDDEGKLCFISRDAKDALIKSLSGRECPILFGHHPISFYSKDARSAFLEFAKQVGAQVYLCGHTHKPKAEVIQYGKGMDTLELVEITLGGIFVDKTGYNEASFAIEELEYDDSGHPKLTVSIYTHIEDAEDVFGFDRWFERTQSRELKSIQPVPTAPLDTQSDDDVQPKVQEEAPQSLQTEESNLIFANSKNNDMNFNKNEKTQSELDTLLHAWNAQPN